MPELLYLDDNGVRVLKTLIGEPTDEQVTTAVNAWLGEHPEATTTVQDGSITGVKIADNTIPDAKLAQTGGVLEAVDEITYTESESETVTETLSLTWGTGYYSEGGMYGASDSYINAAINVVEGDSIALYKANTAAIGAVRFLTAYDGDTVKESLGGQNVSLPFTVPEGVDKIICSIAASYGTDAYGTKSYTTTVDHTLPILKPDVDALLDAAASAKPNSITYAFDLAANGTYETATTFEDMCGYRICLFAKIGTFAGETKIGKGIGLAYGGGFGFDNTNLYEYIGTTATAVRTQAHGLTIKDYVGIIIDVGYDASSGTKCTISTNSGTYTWTLPYFKSRYGTLSVATAAELSDCVLSYTCEGIERDTWIYGDSYLDNSGTNRWSIYLVASGYRNYLLNGYPGRASSLALASMKVDLSMGRIPRRIVWCMGMNDKDGASAPNTGWKNSLDELMELCESKHIELILATIPNVPSASTDNTKKNAYVVASGYRYIDFANAVSADGSSTWYDDMLSSDNVHPDVQGAIALYNCAVTTVPELLL